MIRERQRRPAGHPRRRRSHADHEQHAHGGGSPCGHRNRGHQRHRVGRGGTTGAGGTGSAGSVGSVGSGGTGIPGMGIAGQFGTAGTGLPGGQCGHDRRGRDRHGQPGPDPQPPGRGPGLLALRRLQHGPHGAVRQQLLRQPHGVPLGDGLLPSGHLELGHRLRRGRRPRRRARPAELRVLRGLHRRGVGQAGRRSAASARSSASARTGPAPSCSSRTARTSRSSSASPTARRPTCRPRRRSTSSRTSPATYDGIFLKLYLDGVGGRLEARRRPAQRRRRARCSWATTPTCAASTASSTTSSSTRCRRRPPRSRS